MIRSAGIHAHAQGKKILLKSNNDDSEPSICNVTSKDGKIERQPTSKWVKFFRYAFGGNPAVPKERKRKYSNNEVNTHRKHIDAPEWLEKVMGFNNPNPLDVRIGYKAGWCLFYFLVHVFFCMYFSIGELGSGDTAKANQSQSALWWIMDMFFVFITCVDIGANLLVSRSEYFWDYARETLVWHNILQVLIVVVALSLGGIPRFQIEDRTTFTLLLSARLLVIGFQLPAVELVTGAFYKSRQEITAAFFLLFVFLYVFGVIMWPIYDQVCTGKDVCDGNNYFGTLPDSMFTQFQMITFDSWSSKIARHLQKLHWWSFFYYVPFQLVVALLVLNVVTGVIVDAMVSMHEHEEEQLEAELKAEEEEKDQVEEGTITVHTGFPPLVDRREEIPLLHQTKDPSSRRPSLKTRRLKRMKELELRLANIKQQTEELLEISWTKVAKVPTDY
eukprot:Platyproteum_vivax@DN1990_c0_g1_i1.p1